MAAPEKVPFVFRCSAHLVEELDALAKENMLERTDLIVAAVDNLVRFMGRHRKTSSLCGTDADDDFESDLEMLQAYETEAPDPDANIIPPMDEGDDDGVF